MTSTATYHIHSLWTLMKMCIKPKAGGDLGTKKGVFCSKKGLFPLHSLANYQFGSIPNLNSIQSLNHGISYPPLSRLADGFF